MTHRHLLPDEIDQLLDGEVGFGVAPLQAHVRDCAECGAAVDDARVVVEALEGLPRLSPAPAFADRVMAEVHVYVPWHSAARQAVVAAVRPLAPRSQPVRVLLGATALSVAALLSAASVWLFGHLDAALFFAGVVRERLLQVASAVGGAVAATLFGAPTAAALARGSSIALFATVLMYAVALLVAAFLVRTVAVSHRRRD
jgi:hypothetical protein